MTELLYGRNAVRECLRARRRYIHKLLLAKETKLTPLIREVVEQAKTLHIPIQRIPRQKLDKLSSGHQGIALEVGRLPTVNLQDLLSHLDKLGQSPFLLAIDHLEDPQNVGALLRTAEAVGVHGVILPARRSVGITPTVVKVSAGASEHLRIVIVSNLVQTLKSFKKAGVWVIGVEKAASAQPYHRVDLNMPLILVVGSEGKGMTRLVSETCDLLLEIPMQGHIASLNVSVAGGLVMYEAWRVRQNS
ncbi:MAG: 23S rRNA (guanosine(2251)-2'-O)-methyltransferase RlmB [Phycisphaerae bacterium]|nr:23S rRNA (guanosine(2251)-2'-O)-methyltransferase RlmB [Phycisphaerae bacterium]NIW92242.1 23S rRNA (guanosine(2251)-2'-O)-methyltransferase RlmB [Phycisphaerae bacterium]NIX27252.1 23S rRNA (guanosine(2251)-2'-O)-methyltransferase RlmB [Phycisphaerae bacterium]